jgi:hypothetical protein
LIFILINFLPFQFLFTEDKNSIWIFGDSSGIDFSTVNSPVPIFSDFTMAYSFITESPFGPKELGIAEIELAEFFFPQLRTT